MTHTYNITGMTCNGCVNKAKGQFLKIGDVTEADVKLDAPQATISMQKHISLTVLQDALNKAGNYTISEAKAEMPHMPIAEDKISWFNTYKPILVIGAYIISITLFIEFASGGFVLNNWMQNFMAAFFLVFSFFKMLDLKGFADSYSTYDIIAKQWKSWGIVYAFIELALGLAYLLRLNSLLTNGVTFLVMSISIIGVVQSVLNKRKIQCACLGAIFKLPMSTITIIEDALMILMSAAMLITMI
jgi:copper chaperone CopZ